MPKYSVFAKDYKSRKQAAAAAALARARATIIAGRRSVGPPRTGGFYAPRFRRRMGELNAVDVDTALYESITTASLTLLNGVAQNDDFTNRIGRKIVMKSLYIRGFIKNFDAISGPSLNRLIVVYDKQSNGAAPAATDILKEATACSQFNLNNRDRFRILVDQQYAIGAIDNTATQAYGAGPICHDIKIYKKLNLETIFGGTGATIASITTGALYMVIVGDQTTTAGGYFKLSTRVRFSD